MTEISYYVIDSSSLIELNQRYPIDVFPSLWKNLEGLIKKGLLISPKEVLKEISVMDNPLKKWAIKQKHLFRDINLNQINIVKEILAKYPALAKSDNEFASADPFVIALAVELSKDPQQTLTPSIKRRIVVTEEKLRGTRHRIPFVCQDYDIECINIIEMYRKEGWKF